MCTRILGIQPVLKGDMSGWPTYAASEATRWEADSGTRLVILGGISCEKLTRGIFFQPNDHKVGPHAFPSNLIYKAHEGLVALRRLAPRLKYFSLFEQVLMATPRWADTYAQLVGHRQLVPLLSSDWSRQGGAVRQREFYTNCTLNVDPWIDASLSGQHDPRRLAGRYFLPADATPRPTGPPPTVKSVYPSLLAKLAATEYFSSRPQQGPPERGTRFWISKVDAARLRGYRIRHYSTGQVVYAGPRQLGHWLGISEVFVDSLLSHWRCQLSIDDIHGQPHDYWQEYRVHHRPPPEAFHDCGVTRLCLKCSEVSEIMGRCWNPLHMKAPMAALLEAVRALVPSSFDPSQTTVHSCPINCPMAETVLTLRQQRL